MRLAGCWALEGVGGGRQGVEFFRVLEERGRVLGVGG